MSNEVLGIDLGGTNFNVGRVNKGMVVQDDSNSVDASITEFALLNRLYETIDGIITQDVTGIGIGVPGIVDQKSGIIYDIQNIPAWQKVPLKQLLEDRYNIPVSLNNDANCFALGEHCFGKGKPFRDFVGLSIGTGLGMGIIIDNSLYSGVMCGAGEIGMLPYKDGILEHYTGSFFFTRKYQQSAKAIHELAQKNQPQAIGAFEEFGIHLGEAIKTILYMYAPEAIVLGGSISSAYPFFRDSMEATVATFTYPKQIEQLQIERSTHPNLPILGAAALCME